MSNPCILSIDIDSLALVVLPLKNQYSRLDDSYLFHWYFSFVDPKILECLV